MSFVAAVAALCSGTILATPTKAAAWTPLDQSTIHPGVQTFTGGAQCTSNFVFTNGADVLLGQAAHCAGTGAATETNGCIAKMLPVGTPVEISGASKPGVLVYSSWAVMQATKETNENVCRYNDFALVRIDPADVRRVNPSVPRFGGPTGVSTGPLGLGAKVVTYGNSSLRFGVTQLSPKVGYNVATIGGGRSHRIYSVSPGIPGDSGSGLLDPSGRALGVLSTVGLYPYALSNNFADLNLAMNYARAHGASNLQLVKGTKAFDGRVAKLVLR